MISILLAVTLYFNNIYLKFVSTGIFFIWSSSVFFLMHNYEGWPTLENPPKADLVYVEVIDPTDTSPGHIFYLSYNLEVANKSFYEYNPPSTPRLHEIPYTDKSGKAFKKAKEMLEKGFSVIIGEDGSPGGKEGEPGTDPTKGEGDSDLSILYDDKKPPLKALNPRKRLQK